MVDQREYRVAFVMNTGAWDVVETFTAGGDDEANAYAGRNYSNAEWFVLNEAGHNINGGCDG
jgi:hypothetical protein